MSNQYKHGDHVPTDVLVKRLRELVEVITKRRVDLKYEFSMSIPAQLDRDADLVLSEVADRLETFDNERKAVRDSVALANYNSESAA